MLIPERYYEVSRECVFPCVCAYVEYMKGPVNPTEAAAVATDDDDADSFGTRSILN